MPRTDRSFVCLACRHRFWPVRRCPACQETSWLVDLEAEPDGLTRPMPGASAGGSRALSGVGIFGLVGAGTAAGIGRLGLAEVLLLPTVLALGAALVSRPARPASTRWSILSGPVARASAPRVSYTGVVQAARGTKLLRSPLLGLPCVAYRVVGESGEMPIDDARARPFELELEDGERIRVNADVATIDLPLHQGDEPRALRPGRAAFLQRRGVLRLDTARVTEAVLQIGDHVLVTGSLREDAIASGYRETRTARTLLDAPGAPLLIRRTPETRVTNRESRDTSA